MTGDAPFANDLLGWRLTSKGNLVPNTADSANASSTAIAARVLAILGVASGVASGVADPATGRPLELAVARELTSALARDRLGRGMVVHSDPRVVTDFVQYSHLSRLDQLAKGSPELRITLGTDYLIKPDVVVSLPGRDGLEMLHAVVSCKWTIRSDRVQNIRHEYNQLIRHRRGRLPHLVTVTAEPLPTRLASIARGTGEVDATYHIAFDALHTAIQELSTSARLPKEQFEAWSEAVGQGRVRPWNELPETISRW